MNPEPSGPSKELASLRVLLIEDNPGDARLVSLHLREALDAEVTLDHAERLSEGLERLQQRRPDLVLLDLNLPDARGLESVRSIRRTDGSLVVVVLTGQDDEGMAVEALREGAQDYLVKDGLGPEGLRRAVRYSLERQRAADEIDRARREAERQRDLSRAILGSLSEHIAVLEADGTIRTVNEAWRTFAGQEGGDPRGYEGDNYLRVTERAAPDDPYARKMLRGLRSVLSGERSAFTLEYPCHSPTERRWFRVSVTPLEDDESSGVVVSHIDVTDQIETERRLRERVKEQSCLYDISMILQDHERELPRRLQETVDRIPEGWQYPDVTVARLRIDEAVYVTEGFTESGRPLVAPVEVDEGEIGELEVRYLEDRPEEDIGPFLVEERRLLDEITDRIAIELGRFEGERERRRLADIVQSTSDFVGLSTADGETLWVNRPGRRMLGIPEDEGLVGEPISDFSPEWAARKIREEGLPAARREGVWEGETALRTRGGEEIPVSQVIVAHRQADGDVSHFSTIARDISDRKAMERALREREVQYRTLVETAAEGILMTDRDGNFEYANAAAEEMLGLEESEIEARSYRDPGWGLTAPDGSPFPDEDLPVARVLRSGAAVTEIEHAVERPDGTRLIISVNAAPLKDEEGRVTGVVATLRDVTDRKKLEKELRFQALHDPLTGLANRTLFEDRLEQAAARARRRSRPIGLLMIDLKRFKRINDGLGHTAGDRVLQEVARRLGGSLRGEDTVARWGGDEFIVLLEDLDDEESLRSAHDRLVGAIRQPLKVADQELHVDVTVGGVFSDHETLSAGHPAGGTADLIRYADQAHRRAKQSTSGALQLYRHEEERQDGGVTWIRREQELRRGLEADEFEPFYQPLVLLDSGEIWGFEPLARWRHPDRGIVSPAEFIPLAEESGLIGRLGGVILEEACRQVARWSERSDRNGRLRVTPNVSGRQFEDRKFVDELAAALDATDLPTDRVLLEVTETSIMRATHRIDELRQLGIGLLVDDFGTGYSSLLYVRDLDVDGLKIDMTFVHGLGVRVRDTAIVETILTLGDQLGLTVVAEGIETEDQLRRIRDMGCTIGQGYLFSRPLPAAEIDRLLEEEDRRELTGLEDEAAGQPDVEEGRSGA